ncbi:hypothetical protein M231_06276 [Tremella mesenterica]|uniref:Cytoplasmic protein n=1 Tax=Tremella mesenterica TaxID=5217 RepID=A0A4Q1BC74_TREME|nr:hypothetical protein M231_06276 [Tremella mesenterica]
MSSSSMVQDGDIIETSYGNFFRSPVHVTEVPTSLILRGVNLGSSAKVPAFRPDTYSNLPQDTREQRDEYRRHLAGFSTHVGGQGALWDEAERGGREGWFVGHPLQEEEADLHFRRLKLWGYRLIRYIIPWEALEHAGPGKYDEAFIDYTIRILRKAKAYGFKVFLSPHQDVFSRFISGSGAPYWVLNALGLSPRRLHQTGAALLHASWETEGYGGEEGLIWQTNLNRLAARHCFTMFWAGERFTPRCTIDGQSAGRWVRTRRTEAYGHLADRFRDAGGLLDDCILGWDSMNEPHEGFIGIPDLNVIPSSQDFRKGPSPTPLQALILGMGQPVEGVQMDDFTSLGPKSKGKISITPPNGQGVWLTREEAREAEERWGYKWGSEWDFWDENGTGGCPWAAHGVWDPNTREILKKDYFRPTGQDLDFQSVFWRPSYTWFMSRIRRAHPNAISFIHPPVFGQPPDISGEEEKGRIALSSHFYDGLTMLGKSRSDSKDAVGIQRGLKTVMQGLNLGRGSIKRNMREQLAELKSDAKKGESIGGSDPIEQYPTVIGEIGTPFDMHKSRLLGLAKGKVDRHDYREPTKAMDEVLSGCDGKNALSYTLWTYEPLNTHSNGDGWNGEDLSIFTYDDLSTDDDLVAHSPKNLESLMLGARGQEAWCRPYPVEVRGRVEEIEFEMSSGEFGLIIDLSPLHNTCESSSSHSTTSAPTSQSQEHSQGDAPRDGTRMYGDPKEEEEKEKQGKALIFVPYVHYLASPSDKSTSAEERGRGRILGGPDEVEWKDGHEARVDIRVKVSDGHVSVRGQWMTWVYPLGGERVEMKFEKWK